MFEDSLVESTGRIRTRSAKLAIGSFLLQAAMVAVLMLIPYLYPASLPRQSLAALLVAPPPPAAPARLPQRPLLSHPVATVQLALLTLPGRIPRHAAVVSQAADPAWIGAGIDSTGASAPGALQNLFSNGTGPALRVVAEPRPRSGPVRISAGVAAGRLLVPIQPIYPIIAKTAHIQGTVVVEATISKTGAVENARAVSGPPMLVPAAISAISRARYQPYRLNGEPVEVETTINVVFTMN